MNFTKITSADTKNKGNKGKADTPSVSTSEMQRILDELSLEVIIPKFNTLSQELDLADIYGRVRSGDVKAVRVNADNQLEISTDGITFEAIGSSGHLVIDKNGTMLPQRGRLRFNGDVTIADDAATNTTAISGLKGDKGDKGEQGMQGIQGVQGVEGKVYTPNISDTGDISWQLINTGGIAPAVRNIRGPQGIDGKQGIQGIQGAPGIKGETGAQGIKGDTGAQGVQGTQGLPGAAGAKGETGAQGPIGPQGMAGGAGADGRSFTTHGRYDTFADLQREHPKGVDGDAWLVGSIGDNDVYIWDIVRVKWECVGPIVGPMGAQGIQGIQGLKGDKGDAGAAGATGQQGAQGVAGAKGDKGEQGLRGDTGAQGIQGIQGQQGERGLQGVQGEHGLRGMPTTVNGKTGENISLTAADVGALAPSGTAANASMLGGQQPSYYQPKSDSTLATSNKTVVGAINEVRSTASSAQSTANNAQSAASNAQSAANSASSTANSAYSTASGAQNAASSAQSTANSALAKANILSGNYSLQEHDTGRKWTDGKPIYEKTIVGTLNPTSTYQQTGFELGLRVNTLVDFSIVGADGTNDYYFGGNSETGIYSDGKAFIRTLFTHSLVYFTYFLGVGLSSPYKMYTTIQYTK